MAMKITEECISCGACIPECPTESISEGDTIYLINADTCVECVGHFDSPQCVSVCPVDCIVNNQHLILLTKGMPVFVSTDAGIFFLI